MSNLKDNVDLNEVRNRTNRRLYDFEKKIKNLKEAIASNDDDHKECLSCRFVIGVRMGMAKITNTSCVICLQEITSGSTDVDHVCHNCATEHNLCTRCGCDKEDIKTKLTETLSIVN